MFELLLQLRQMRGDCCAIAWHAVVHDPAESLDLSNRRLPVQHCFLLVAGVADALELVHSVQHGNALLHAELLLLLHLLLRPKKFRVCSLRLIFVLGVLM